MRGAGCARDRIARCRGRVIWSYAEQNGYVIVTKDEDFVLRVQSTEVGPRVLWLRVGNTSNVRLRAWFIPQVPQLVALLGQGCRLVEVR